MMKTSSKSALAKLPTNEQDEQDLYQDTPYSINNRSVFRFFLFSGEPLLRWDDIISNVFFVANAISSIK
jgi:hypothetical protein